MDKTNKESELIKPDGWIYLATTKQHIKNNMFKLGSTEKLSRKMLNYQTDKDNEYYYVYIYHTAHMQLLEETLKDLLAKFKDNKSKEMIVFPWELLHKYVDDICTNFNECIIPKINQLIIDNLEFDYSNSKIPEPLDISGEEYD